MRKFDEWFSHFRSSISDYAYYVDFEKVHRNVDEIKVELNILNALIGSKNIEADFDKILAKYPQVLKCIPLLLAVRAKEIYTIDSDGEYLFSFDKMNYTSNDYRMFMRKTGLFDLLENHIISSLVDYATGVETGLDSNGRKNRGGHLMENLVESHLTKGGFILNETYFKQITTKDIESKWNVDLSEITNNNKSTKRFDFVVKTKAKIYAIEANFYGSSGSKLNETARSYKNIALGSKNIKDFTFVWFTDGFGWVNARHNLEETFDVMEHIYSIHDMENGIMSRLFI
ncbi:MAG: restriction endonuclease [Clostridiales bacterium]|jgi:type II restriction enzyme|nr:restriction endonuclease [Clostridiales bacterium]